MFFFILSEPTIALGRSYFGENPQNTLSPLKILIKKFKVHNTSYNMKGLCHSCLTSDVELVISKGKIICSVCHEKIKEK